LAIGCFSFVYACKKNSRPGPRAAFYHWQTSLHLHQQERAYLDSLMAGRLYAKFFDVDWDAATGQAVPLATIEIDTARLYGLDIVPTVFITNRTFDHLPMEQVPALADQVLKKINSLARPLPISAYQFDCDWTEATQEKFFAFLLHFKKNLANGHPVPSPTTSATIRLHQLKFFEKTGVPPVDKGMLMFYNMGDLDDWPTNNSIFDMDEAGKYLPGKPYPLPLDLALPLFRWGAVFRDGQLARLINDLGREDLLDTAFFRPAAPSRFEVVKSTYLRGQYLYKGDWVRLESVAAEDLKKSACILSNVYDLAPSEIAFYHLDTAIIKRYPAAKTKDVLNCF
jgi:hypothetical protein